MNPLRRLGRHVNPWRLCWLTAPACRDDMRDLEGATRRAFLSFLLDAKRATYAAQGDEATVVPVLAGSKQLEYPAGDYTYRDVYFGMSYFVGQEVVTDRERALWSMSYAGGVVQPERASTDTRVIYAFLRRR